MAWVRWEAVVVGRVKEASWRPQELQRSKAEGLEGSALSKLLRTFSSMTHSSQPCLSRHSCRSI